MQVLLVDLYFWARREEYGGEGLGDKMRVKRIEGKGVGRRVIIEREEDLSNTTINTLQPQTQFELIRVPNVDCFYMRGILYTSPDSINVSRHSTHVFR